MSFCISCGKEISSGARFCGLCGTEQLVNIKSCKKCDRKLEENEKFCPDCGTSTAHPPEKQAASKPSKSQSKEEKLTPEGKKIIDAGSEPPRKQSTKPIGVPPSAKKKKKGCLGLLIKGFVILLILLIAIITLLYFASDWLDDPEDKLTGTNIPGIVDIELGDKLIVTNIPGIVDIEPGDVSHLPENRKEMAKAISTQAIAEGKAIKEAAKSVEKAFANADLALLKQQLSESAQIQYNNVFVQIQPYMKNYAEAFKNRKLVTSTEVYKVYEFSGGSGEKYSAAFAIQPDGSWKLVRF